MTRQSFQGRGSSPPSWGTAPVSAFVSPGMEVGGGLSAWLLGLTLRVTLNIGCLQHTQISPLPALLFFLSNYAPLSDVSGTFSLLHSLHGLFPPDMTRELQIPLKPAVHLKNRPSSAGREDVQSLGSWFRGVALCSLTTRSPGKPCSLATRAADMPGRRSDTSSFRCFQRLLA